jgi:hypothetical protein
MDDTPERKCDYNKWLSDPCQELGIYGYPDWPISDEFPTTDAWIRTLRWCEKHRHENDVLITANAVVTITAWKIPK